MTELEKNILEVIADYHNKTDGKCGITAIQIAQKLNIDYKDIRDSMNNLYENSKFKVRQGINNVLIFKK